MEDNNNINKRRRGGGERWSSSKDDDDSSQEDCQHVSSSLVKFNQGQQVIESWFYNQLFTKLRCLLTKIGSEEVLEVAVKSFGAFVGNTKVVVNGANYVINVVVIKPLSVIIISSKIAYV